MTHPVLPVKKHSVFWFSHHNHPLSFSIRKQGAVGVYKGPQQRYFGVSAVNNASEVTNHCDALNKLVVEGCESISKTEAGSGAGCGLRAGTGSSPFGIEPQALKANKVSAYRVAARTLRSGEVIRRLLRCGGVRGHQGRSLLCLRQRGARTVCVGLRSARCKRPVRVSLHHQQPGLDGEQRAGCVERKGSDWGEHVSPFLRPHKRAVSSPRS